MAKTKKAGKETGAFAPRKITKKPALVEREDEGPLGWFLEQAETAYSPLAPLAAAAEVAASVAASVVGGIASRVMPGAAVPVAAAAAAVLPAMDVWRERLAQYKQRKAAVRLAERMVTPGAPLARAVPMAPGAPIVPGGRNWVPLGPSVVLKGQTVGEEPIAGRVVGLAISADGAIIYAASACGGVFRSDDAGTSWRSLMNDFDVDPSNFASTSLACGAIAIDMNDPDRVYVGTGEGETHQIFARRIVNALPAYRGIGPIRSDDGGQTWMVEKTAAGSPELAGRAFFAMAVDPRDRENVVAATTDGLYQRAPSAGAALEWRLRRSGVHSSVVVARSGATTRFFAAEWGKGVFHSTNGLNWNTTGTGFPASNVGRIALGVQPNNPDRIYAFVANANGAVLGVFRVNGVGGAWKKIANPPDVIPSSGGQGQGDYDLAIAVDPQDANIVYLGGSYFNASPFAGSVWRCLVQATASGFKFKAPASIGTHAHADVHVLRHTPGNSNELWCGCDGGVFLNRAPRTVGQFAGLNNGLSCLCSNFIAQHPLDPSILFSGLQDNGTIETSGSAQWNHVNYGDGGYCLINWADPTQVLSFVNGSVYRSTTGGTTHTGWTEVWAFDWATMTQPIVSPPYEPNSPANAKWVAVGAGAMVFVSKDFAGTWPMQFTIPGGLAAGQVFALAFASTTRLFIGTTQGRVFRADRAGNTWTVTRIDNAAAGAIAVQGLVSDIAVDVSDATLSSIYASFGGMGDHRHVWRFDGNAKAWSARSGNAPGVNLLDVEHNALAVDPRPPHDVYVGADIGVWHSPDQGASWTPLQNGLPDAPVFDLQIHPTQRLLRAATHGRGVYEIALP